MNRLNLKRLLSGRKKHIIFYWAVKILYNEEDILEQDDETDKYIKALDDFDVDDMEEELKPVGNVESEEYRR